MDRTRLIRCVSVPLIVVLLLDYAYSGWYVAFLGSEIEKLMQINGFGSIVEPQTWMFHFYYLSLTTVLLWIVYSWQAARFLYFVLIAVALVSAGLFGASVSIPSQTILATLEAYLTGALLFLLIVPIRLRSSTGET